MTFKGVYGKTLVASLNRFKEVFGVDDDFSDENVKISKNHIVGFVLGKVIIEEGNAFKLPKISFENAKFIIGGKVDFRKLRGRFYYKVLNSFFDSYFIHESIKCLCLNNEKMIDVWILLDKRYDFCALALGNSNGLIIISCYISPSGEIFDINNLFSTIYDKPIFSEVYDICSSGIGVQIDINIINQWLKELKL